MGVDGFVVDPREDALECALAGCCVLVDGDGYRRGVANCASSTRDHQGDLRVRGRWCCTVAAAASESEQ